MFDRLRSEQIKLVWTRARAMFPKITFNISPMTLIVKVVAGQFGGIFDRSSEDIIILLTYTNVLERTYSVFKSTCLDQLLALRSELWSFPQTADCCCQFGSAPLALFWFLSVEDWLAGHNFQLFMQNRLIKEKRGESNLLVPNLKETEKQLEIRCQTTWPIYSAPKNSSHDAQLMHVLLEKIRSLF